MTDLAGPLAAFLQEHLPRDRGASPHTVASYAASFKLLAVFAAERHKLRPCRLEVGHLDIPTLLAFLQHLETDRDNGVRTRNARLSAIKSFFRYLEFRHPECLDLAAQVHALPQKKADLPPVDYLDRDEVRALLEAPAADTASGLRDRAMLCLAYNAGLRVSELVGLSLDDLQAPALDRIRVLGKGRRGRVLPLWKETRGALRSWLAVRPDSPDRHLFLNASRTGLTRRGFAKRLALHAEAAARAVPSIAGKAVTPHALRHACALHTLEATSDIRQVALWLGHASLRSTEMYLRVDPANKLVILAAQQPPNLRRGSFEGEHDELLAMLGAVAVA